MRLIAVFVLSLGFSLPALASEQWELECNTFQKNVCLLDLRGPNQSFPLSADIGFVMSIKNTKSTATAQLKWLQVQSDGIGSSYKNIPAQVSAFTRGVGSIEFEVVATSPKYPSARLLTISKIHCSVDELLLQRGVGQCADCRATDVTFGGPKDEPPSSATGYSNREYLSLCSKSN
jgi:hypothetical protein